MNNDFFFSDTYGLRSLRFVQGFNEVDDLNDI
jgi:hypothetical protein